MYDLLRDQVTRWQIVHIGTLFFIGLMGVAVFLLVRSLESTAARVARIAAGTFVVFYGAWEAVAGLAAGALAQHTNGLPADERAVGSDAIQSIALACFAGAVLLIYRGSPITAESTP